MIKLSMFKTIISHAPKYFSATAISSLVMILMTKYYTYVFSPAEYGVLALYLIMFNYIKTFVSLNLNSSSTRFYFDYRETKRDEYLSTIFWFITIIAIIVSILGIFLKDMISNWIAPNSESIYLITLFTGIGAVYVTFLMRILYNEQKSTSVLKHTLFQTFVNHFSSFVFISFFNLGILGRMLGQGVGYGLNIFTLLREFFSKNIFKIRPVFNKIMAKETFLLSLPGIIASIQNVVFIYLDRVFIKYYIGNSSVGIYTLGYMLGQGLSLVYEAISQAILPKVYNDMNENYKRARFELEKFSYGYYMGLILITVIISILSPFIVEVLSNSNYMKASEVMPFVMAGFMMGGFYKIPSLILGYHKVVWFYPLLSLFSFGVNALLNWYLVPRFGIIGAGFASFVGLFLYSTILQLISLKYMSKKYNIFVIIVYVLLFFVVLSIFKGAV